ncbi:VOC family protein [Cellulomonas sp. P22]|uniref:VOC family protein n=1 Tax=Cellulomonas sp. P22 TaxID=3373189 RepID=UPI0037AE1F8C
MTADENADENETPEPSRRAAPGVWPTLTYRDADAALGYLVDVVGFVVSEVHRGDSGRPVEHAELLWPYGGGLMLGSDQPGNRWSGEIGQPGTSTAYLAAPVATVADVAGRVAGAGWTISQPLADTGYGAVGFTFLDPEGNAWNLGTYRGAGF